MNAMKRIMNPDVEDLRNNEILAYDNFGGKVIYTKAMQNDLLKSNDFRKLLLKSNGKIEQIK